MSQVAGLEQQLKNAKALVAKRDLALKLSKNLDFKKLILEDFCVTECARYAQLSADPSLGPVERADSLALAQAAGHLKRFLSVVVAMGNTAEGELKALPEAIDEARAEDEAGE